MAAAMKPTEPSPDAVRQPPPSLEAVAAAFPQLEILGLIGHGGMGCVFKARQAKLDRLVALKLLPAALAERDAAFAGRFEREGQLLARLHHPNIVAVHDSGTAGEFFYLIMEFVDGVNLRQAMRARRFTPVQALAIVPHICDALQFAHDEGVLHRDIKPENILLDAKGRVKLADFGIAKLIGSNADTPFRDFAGQSEAAGLTQSGTALGTPSYMAPEQRDTPADVDHRADIYSLGVVFYELLTGELPHGPLARPSEKSAADPRVDAIVQQAMETERGRRQHSAGEVKTQVETLASAPARPAAKLRKKTAAVLLLAAVLIGVATFWSLHRAPQQSKAPAPLDGPRGYSAVVETTLPDGEMIDFDTGKIVSWADMPQFPKYRTFNEEFWDNFAKSAAGAKDAQAPAPPRQTDDKERDLMMHAWMQQHGLDAFYEMHDDKNLLNLGMTVIPMVSGNWDKLIAYHLHLELAAPRESRMPLVRLPAEGKEMPGPENETRATLWANGFPTFAFRTREGGEGLLQITGYGKDRSTLKLRYKLTSAAFQKQLTAPASFESVTGGAQALFTMIVPHPAKIGVSTADEFTAQHATQEFEIHTQFKTGEVAQKSQKETGPSAEGFMLTVRRLKEPLVSAVDTPQFLDRPYWKSYINSRFDPATGQGVAVYFDFGVRLDPDFKKAMLELLQLRDGMVRFSPVQAKVAEVWGEAVDGVQASLRAEREKWGKGELPAFKLAIRNQGTHSPFVARQQEVAEVEFDGQWYDYSGTVDVLSGPIQPGEQFDNIAVTLDPKSWHPKTTHEPLALKAGEHTVRVSMGLENPNPPSVRVISNPIKINLHDKHEPLPPR